MNYWNRALCSVTRRKGKSIILFAVILVLGNVIAGAIAIQQSTSNVENKIKSQLGATATVDMDFEKFMAENTDGKLAYPEGMQVEDIKKMGDSPYVKEYDYSISGYLQLKKLKSYELEKEDNAMMSVAMSNHLSLKGNNLIEPLDFKEKKMKLVDGRMFTQEELENGKDVAIVSKKVADANGLSVGDQMIMDAVGMDYKQDGTTEELYTQDHPVEIIGLFEPTSINQKKEENKEKKSNDFGQQAMETEQFNTVYMPNNTVSAINKAEFDKGKSVAPENYKNTDGTEMTVEQSQQITPTFILKKPEDVDTFKQEMKSLVPEFYKINASTDQYDQVGGTFKKMAQISGYVVFLAIGATLLIISLVVILFLRDRKHELGIYLSLGEKRSHVMQQIIIELLLISIVAMCLSLITGNILGKMVSESLVASDSLVNAENSNSIQNMVNMSSPVGGQTLTAEDVSSAYEVTFSISYIATFLIAGLGTVFLSAILPLTYVMRLNPKKIMM